LPRASGSMVFIAVAGIIAAIYAALCVLLQPISYGPIQFRVADALSLLPYNPALGAAAVIGLTIGTLIANAFSPYGVYDMAVGTLTSLIYSVAVYYIGKKWYGKLWSLLLAIAVEVATITLMIGYVLLHLIAGEPAEVSVPGVALGSVVANGILGSAVVKTSERLVRKR